MLKKIKNTKMNKHLKYTHVQNIHKTETWNSSCDNQYSVYQYLGSSLRT